MRTSTMRRKAVASIYVAASMFLVAACSSTKPPEEDPNAFPADYKNEILLTMTNMLVDPTNIRDAFITDPILRQVGTQQRYIACVRSDARNASKHYEGSKDRIAYFYGGHLNQLVDAT